jgi:CBS domain containing-hemolysin-like protein
VFCYTLVLCEIAPKSIAVQHATAVVGLYKLEVS